MCWVANTERNGKTEIWQELPYRDWAVSSLVSEIDYEIDHVITDVQSLIEREATKAALLGGSADYTDGDARRYRVFEK